MKYLVLLLFSITIISCSKTENKSVVQGGQDSGGGNTVFSTDKEIEDTYLEVIEDLPKAVNSILDLYFIESVSNKEKKILLRAFKNKLTELVPEEERAQIDKEIEDHEMYSMKERPAPLRRAFEKIVKASEIIIKKDGPCASQDKPHGYASIKEFKIGSPICISFYQLKTIPQDSLYKEILGVMLHEYLHALDFGEKNAITIQTVITSSFSILTKTLKGGFEPLSNNFQRGFLAANTEVIKKYSSMVGKLKEEEQAELCKNIAEMSLLGQSLYQIYTKALRENKKWLLDKKIINERIVLNLERALHPMVLTFGLDSIEELKPITTKCDAGEQVEITYALQAHLIILYTEIFIAIDAMEEIDLLLSSIY
ncbi:MAG: hypothetical protein V4596_09720 [Bdellovibrionota bacterium]